MKLLLVFVLFLINCAVLNRTDYVSCNSPKEIQTCLEKQIRRKVVVISFTKVDSDMYLVKFKVIGELDGPDSKSSSQSW